MNRYSIIVQTKVAQRTPQASTTKQLERRIFSMPPQRSHTSSWLTLGLTVTAVGLAATAGVIALASIDTKRKKDEKDILSKAEEKKHKSHVSDILTDIESNRVPPSISPTERRELWLRLSSEAAVEVSSVDISSSLELNALQSEYINLCQTLLKPHSTLLEEDVRNLEAISRDVGRTFSVIYGREYHSHPESIEVDRKCLTRILGAYALRDSTVGYVQGMNFIAAFALSRVGNDEAVAYALLVRLLNAPRYSMRNLYLPSLPHVKVWGYVLKSIIWQALPEVAAHLETVGVDPIFFFEWYFALFVLILPPEICAEAWDDFLKDGWSSAFRIILCLLSILQPHLLDKDFYGTLLSLKAFSNARTASEIESGKETVNRDCPQSSNIGKDNTSRQQLSRIEGMLIITPPRGLVALSRKHFEIYTSKERIEQLEQLGLRLAVETTLSSTKRGNSSRDDSAAGLIGNEFE